MIDPLSVKGPPRRAKKSWRVILATVDAKKRSEIARHLRDLGCQVATASTGTDLLQKLGTAILNDDVRRQPALIIADLRLAGCSGISVLEGLRSLLWDTPFFLIVDHDDEPVARLAFSLGASRVFEKPLQAEEVATAAITCLLSRAPIKRAKVRHQRVVS